MHISLYKTYGTNPLPKNMSFCNSSSRNDKNTDLNFSTAESKGTKNNLLDSVNSKLTLSLLENSFPKENIFNSQRIKCSSPHKAGCYYCGILNNGKKFFITNSMKRTISPSVFLRKEGKNINASLNITNTKTLTEKINISTSTRSPEKNLYPNNNESIEEKHDSIRQFLNSKYKYATLLPRNEEYNSKIKCYIESLEKYRHFSQNLLKGKKNFKNNKPRITVKSVEKMKCIRLSIKLSKVTIIQKIWRTHFHEYVLPRLIYIQKISRGMKIRKRIASIKLIINHVTVKLRILHKILNKKNINHAWNMIKKSKRINSHKMKKANNILNNIITRLFIIFIEKFKIKSKNKSNENSSAEIFITNIHFKECYRYIQILKRQSHLSEKTKSIFLKIDNKIKKLSLFRWSKIIQILISKEENVQKFISKISFFQQFYFKQIFFKNADKSGLLSKIISKIDKIYLKEKIKNSQCKFKQITNFLKYREGFILSVNKSWYSFKKERFFNNIFMKSNCQRVIF